LNQNNKSNVQKERVLVTKKIQKTDMTLPKEVGEALRSLPIKERKAYASLLRKAGWTLQAIATELNVTRESIRLYAVEEHTGEYLSKVSHLPIPEVPMVEIYKDKVIKVLPSAEVLAKLKELQAKATLVRGKGKANREEAEQYTKLLYETMQSGVSGYRLAKELNVTHSALLFRLVRYGYTTTTGKSHTYRQLTHRKREEENA
jgi:predicted transcriptional regulator